MSQAGAPCRYEQKMPGTYAKAHFCRQGVPRLGACDLSLWKVSISSIPKPRCRGSWRQGALYPSPIACILYPVSFQLRRRMDRPRVGVAARVFFFSHALVVSSVARDGVQGGACAQSPHRPRMDDAASEDSCPRASLWPRVCRCIWKIYGTGGGGRHFRMDGVANSARKSRCSVDGPHPSPAVRLCPCDLLV